ncbi:MAG: c-type cytochrome [Planctomycetes bacterium]|nr:c-type cytochrome [Planctomycetota bacterium]
MGERSRMESAYSIAHGIIRGRWGISVLLTALLALSLGAESASTPPAKTPTDVKPLDYQRWHTNEPGEYTGYNQRATLVQRGKEVYQKYCIGCHGENGDGNGDAAKRLITKPRDFTKGIYKFRSTDSGSLPLDNDLYRTITRGLPGVSMPAFPLMPDREKVEVIEYIKAFYAKWEEEKSARVVVPVPAAPQDLASPERINRGHFVYAAIGCGKCHGVDGQGLNATLTQYTDAWGNPQKPFNFTRGRLKGGDDPEDIYRTFQTGLRSIMPAFAGATMAAPNQATVESQQDQLRPGELEALRPVFDQFPKTAAEVFSGMDEMKRRELVDRNSWDLVAYIQSLRRNTTTATAVLGFDPESDTHQTPAADAATKP